MPFPRFIRTKLKGLFGYNGLHHSFVHQNLVNQPTMQIFVKTVTGRTIVFDIEGSETVNDLKEMIFEKDGIPVKSQRLLHQGKQLDSNRTLVESGVERESTIHIVLHLIGGAVETSIFIPSIYANITDKDIAKTFRRMKIGKVSYVDLVPHKGHDKNGKFNRAFVYFSELYDTAESQTLMNEIHSQESTRLHYAKSPHVFWVLVKNKGRSTNKVDFRRHHSPSFEALSDDEYGFDSFEYYDESSNTKPMTMRELDISNVYDDKSSNTKPMTMSELDISNVYDEVHSIADSFDDMVNEFENEMNPVEDFSVVSSDYANQLEVELFNLRCHYNMLAASYMQQQEYYHQQSNEQEAVAA